MAQEEERRKTGIGDVLGLVAGRLYDARYVLGVSVALAVLLLVFDGIPEWQLWIGIAVLIASAMLPVRSRAVRREERLLRQSSVREPVENALFAAFEALEDPAIILSEASNVVFQNRAAIDRFGPLARGAHISSRLRSPQILELVRNGTVGGQPGSIDYVEKVPSERWYRVRFTPMEAFAATRGGSNLYMLIFRDQSDFRRMDRMRTDFIANASHELRTPLASLTGFIETLQGPARKDPAAQERFLGIMAEQAGRMTRLVDDLLSLSRLEMKAHQMPGEEVDIVPLVRHVCDTLRPLAEELDVEIRIETPDTPVMVNGDRDELIQVFENLIENACKYGQSGKRVEVTVRPALPENRRPIEVSVRDHGPGIASEHVPRLTERFYRVDVESSRSKKGTGLGLAIVKHILTRHRARLVVNSGPGQGSDFVVRFEAMPAKLAGN
jgi:two-component system phosphate regulon sensor histidine kinase PhoR